VSVRAHTGRAAFRVALAASLSAALAGTVLQLSAWAISGTFSLEPWWWASLLAAALAGALAAAQVVRRSFGKRLNHMAQLLDRRVHESDFLARLPDLGDDDVGTIAQAFNRLLARITTLQTDVIDQGRALEDTQRALALAEQLAEKQRELEQRLRERALLFEVLRESASSHDLGRVLDALVQRVGTALRLQQIVVLLRCDEGAGDEQYEVRAAYGLESELVGTRVQRPVSGPWAGEGGLLLVPDVARAPQAVAFWPHRPAEGSLAAVPIRHGSESIGMLVLVRPEDDPIGELEARYLQAVADQAALAIHNAQLVERLERLSTHDELTGLPNRRLFWRHFERALVRAARYPEELSVLVLDVDHFKQLNDHRGHGAGDEALVAVATALREGLRESDTAARAGGEELWVLLPHTGPEGALEVAEKLRRKIAGLEVPGAAEQPLGHLSVSIGVATHRPGESAESVIARADAALYEAKRGGRDRVVAAR
jgi:diguanylate cyclase (GGDEF)-like protein